MENGTLHYIYDPLCGWCYGAAPLVAVARELAPVIAHGGGMLSGAARVRVSPQFRAFAAQHDEQITRLTGQPFGSRYVDGLLADTSVLLDSEPPIAAVLTAERLAARGLDMLARLQRAHYVEGRRVAERDVLVQLAADIGLDEKAFETTFAQITGSETAQHIENSRELLARLGSHGFPTMALKTPKGLQTIDLGRFLGQPQRWRDWLKGQMGLAA